MSTVKYTRLTNNSVARPQSPRTMVWATAVLSRLLEVGMLLEILLLVAESPPGVVATQEVVVAGRRHTLTGYDHNHERRG